MDFKQTEKKFEKLKAEFAAGILSEARFKTQLEELMLQDEQGSWWMIGYETEQWYRHDGKDWVRTDPPGTHARKSAPPPLRQQISRDIPRTDLDNQRSLWKLGRKEVIQSAIGLGIFTVVYFLFGPSSDRSPIFSAYGAFAVPLFFGVAFGPIVGAIVGAGGYILFTIFWFYQYYSGVDFTRYFLVFSTAALFAAALSGFIMGFAKSPSKNYGSIKSILRVELFIILAIAARLLLSTELQQMFRFGGSFYLTLERFGIWSSSVWSLILVPIALIVYSFILSRIRPRT